MIRWKVVAEWQDGAVWFPKYAASDDPLIPVVDGGEFRVLQHQVGGEWIDVPTVRAA